MFLQVTNNGAKPFSSKFDGIEYTFPPKKSTVISADAAQHIFGVGLPDKTEVLTRHGWMNHSSGRANAMAVLDSFSFDIPNDNPEDEPVVEFPPVAEPVVDNEQGSAPLQLGTGSEAPVPDGAVVDEPAPISEPSESEPSEDVRGGNILDGIKKFLT